MTLILILLISLTPPVHAKNARTVELTDGEIAPIYVEAGFSTVLKFDSRPERGLIGDQDGFKVEYLKNVVAIKPLVLTGRTNLFLFTKEGQFNFQLIAGRGRHDNVIYVRPKSERALQSPPAQNGRISIPLEALRTKIINKSANLASMRLTVVSVAMPPSGSTLVVRFILSGSRDAHENLNAKTLSIVQGERYARVENIYLETRLTKPNVLETAGLLMIRAHGFSPRQPLQLCYRINPADKQELSVTFAP